ncbi:MAG: endonuclease/exonuclease/phosphatase family protein, partial [Comamonas sp.]
MTSESLAPVPPTETTPFGTILPPEPGVLRVATYNIHKGVQGLGPTRRLEIHNLGLAVEQLDADIVCLQEVRKMNRREETYFNNWPKVSQAEFLAPDGYVAV